MLKRIAEPDLMDSKAQAEAYASTDFSEPHNSFVTNFKKRFPEFNEGEVLDLGCGTADVIIRFARAFPKTCILGIDRADSMLAIGLKDINKHGLNGQITLKKCIIPDSGLSARKYDTVISNSLLHHLADPLLMWQVMEQYSRPGTALYAMDLMRPDSREKAKEFVQMYAADAPDLLKEDFYNSLLAAYNIYEIKEQLLTAKLDYLNIEVVSDRHILVWGTKQ